MDDLPELPFEQVLSYLSLEDRLKARAVSRRWYHMINSFKVKSLCYSSRSSDFILGKNRWVSGAFAQNFISSTRFASFFDTYGQTILSSLKRLRLCDLNLRTSNETALIRTLNSFSQLETLDMIRVQCCPQRKFELTLPMLTSIHLERFEDRELALEVPRLRKVTIFDCPGLKLGIVRSDSVETFITRGMNPVEVTNLTNFRNLKYLYADLLAIDSTFLSSRQQLKEVHTIDWGKISELFKQKQRLGLADLKIYFRGLLLNGPDDPAMNVLHDSGGCLSKESLVFLAENRSRLADETPFYLFLGYSDIQGVAPELEVGLLKQCTELRSIYANRPVQNIERFLDLLKNFEFIFQLSFYGDQPQPQDLFNRLPEHCAVQKLTVYKEPSDLAFLFRLKHLIHLVLLWSTDSETVRRAFEELPVLSCLEFRKARGDSSELATIEIDRSKRFRASIIDYNDNYDFGKTVTVSDLNAAIEFIYEKEQKKRKADELDQ